MIKEKISLPFLLAMLLLVLVGVVYANSFRGVFILDDDTNILEFKKVHSLSWPWNFIHNVRRPFLYLSLAVNYAIGGRDVFGYHLFNLTIHALAGLVLFGLIRRTWLVEKGKASGNEAAVIAFFVAAIWLVHPLQTESVTYIIQRAESMMGLFFLLSLYASMRFFISGRKRWVSVAGLAAFLSGLTKEVAIMLPLVVLLYDRTHFAVSFQDAVKRHRWLYAAFVPTVIVMAFLSLTVNSEYIPTAGFRYAGVTWLEYAATQPVVILHYLRMAFWPWPLVFDYGWPVSRGPLEIIAPLVAMWGLVSLSISLCRRKPAAGFWALSFFLILIPSSSFIPLKDLAFEHRLYLSLIAPVMLVVWGGWALLNRFVVMEKVRLRIAFVIGILIIGILGAVTVRRNKDYASEMGMWKDVLVKRPLNARAYNNYGRFLDEAGQKDEAVRYYRRAIDLSPQYGDAYLNLGSALIAKGQYPEATKYTVEAIKLNPYDGVAYNNYGAILLNQERFAESINFFEQAITLGFHEPGVYHNVGIAYAKTGEPYKAIENIQEALRLNPELKDAADNLKEIFTKLNAEKKARPGPRGE